MRNESIIATLDRYDDCLTAKVHRLLILFWLARTLPSRILVLANHILSIRVRIRSSVVFVCLSYNRLLPRN